MSDESNNPVLRVTQLDTHELNESLLLSIKRSLNEDYFKYIQLKPIQRYHVEIFAGLKFILWYHTYGKSGQTVGQTIFDWSYVFDNKSKRALLIKKLVHACVFCLDEWFEVKLLRLLKGLIKFVFRKRETFFSGSSEQNPSSYDQRLNQVIDVISKIYKSLSFLNYILFLFDGKYLKLWERVLNFQPVYNNPQYMPQTNLATDASIREELWQTYFSLFRLGNSLFDFQKLLNLVKKKVNFSQKTLNVSQTTNGIDITTCAICKNEPVVAHRSISRQESDSQCKHVFCYFCIRQALTETGLDKSYLCAICSKSVYDIELFIKS